MRSTTVLSSTELESLARLGQTIRLARLRRNLSQDELAERVGVTRPSIIALERGKPGVAIGILLRTLTVLGYTERLGEVLSSDPIGDDIDLVAGRLRAGVRSHVADF
jgi:transcriptional regulator with XRE-family HTH domain